MAVKPTDPSFSFFILSTTPTKSQATIVYLGILWRLASNGADSYLVVGLGVGTSRDRAEKKR